MKFLDQRQGMNVWRFIQTINEYANFLVQFLYDELIPGYVQ